MIKFKYFVLLDKISEKLMNLKLWYRGWKIKHSTVVVKTDDILELLQAHQNRINADLKKIAPLMSDTIEIGDTQLKKEDIGCTINFKIAFDLTFEEAEKIKNNKEEHYKVIAHLVEDVLKNYLQGL